MSQLREVLGRIAQARDAEELRAVIPQARALQERERGIARWSYAYAAAQLAESRWPSA